MPPIECLLDFQKLVKESCILSHMTHPTKSYLNKKKWELQYRLRCSHQAYGKGIHGIVDNFFKAENGKGELVFKVSAPTLYGLQNSSLW